MAVPALFTGILYDTRAFDQAVALLEPLSLDVVDRDRPALIRDGLAAPLGDKRAVDYAQALYDLASSGLSRRNHRSSTNEDERCFLRPLRRLLSAAESPADDLRRGLDLNATLTPAEVIARCKIA